MPIISTIGRRSLKVRLLIGTIYTVLVLGGITMVYPFLLMIAGSSKSAVDTPDAVIIPAFLQNDDELYKKHMEGFFNEQLDAMKACCDVNISSFRDAVPPKKVNGLTKEWEEFLKQNELPPYSYALSYTCAPISRRTIPSNLRLFKSLMIDKFNNDINRLNSKMGMEFVNWNSFQVPVEYYVNRTMRIRRGPFQDAINEFKESRPFSERYYFSIEGAYKSGFLQIQYSKEITNYNQAHGTNYQSYDQVHLSRRYPGGSNYTDKERADWELYVRELIGLQWLKVDQKIADNYQRFLQAKYESIENLNNRHGTRHGTWSDIAFPTVMPKKGVPLSDWEAFIQGWKDPDNGTVHQAPITSMEITGTDFAFRDYLKSKYKQVTDLNSACATSIATWNQIIPPQYEWHYAKFKTETGSLRWEFIIRNFISVTDYIVLHGRGVYNTFIYCGLAILCALTVNPLAAYALSRFKPPSTYKILLLLMLTMAFPPMVTQIPNFLLLREFNLLNTFWALILPTVANGYSIFLLKGFFDSLPKELYESAELDGAGEFRIFWQFTMALSKPILAVIALQTFTMAYSNFMMALLVCQDENMWTLMPWLYTLQRSSGEGVIYASLLIAAIPTFLIFVFCQKIIMRGIVVPTEK